MTEQSSGDVPWDSPVQVRATGAKRGAIPTGERDDGVAAAGTADGAHR
ncbi:MAG: hypothetical protein ACO21P_03355 [Candidatus Nanopelagicales bacterium]